MIENKLGIKCIQILPAPKEAATGNIREGLHY